LISQYGRKFFITCLSYFVLVGYGFSCIRFPILKEIATPFCSTVGAIACAFMAINGLNDYTSMKKEAAKNGIDKTIIS
jgi:hypothetical protein